MDHFELFQYNSTVILSFFFISFFVLILSLITKGKSNDLLFSNYRSSLLNPLTYFRLFSHIFGHANWSHFMNNFMTILLVGPLCEEKYGSLNLLIMILVTAGVTGVFNMIIGKKRILGASGVAFMLIVLSSLANIEAGKIPLTLVLICLFYLINEIIAGLFKHDGVSHLSHILGAACGVILGIFVF